MLVLLVLLVLFYFYIDCDFTTFFYHLYRLRFNKDGYHNQTLWIVGASSGVGEQLCYEAVNKGAKCVIISARRVNELNRVKEECEKMDSGCRVIVKPLDLLELGKSRETALDLVQSSILNDEDIEDVDILIINSGVTSRGAVLETDLSVLTRLYDINVLGVFALIQAFSACLPLLNSARTRRAKQTTRRGSLSQSSGSSAKGGKARSIFVTSSLGGKIGSPGQAAYCMSKHAINGLLEALRVELFALNVHVGIVCPGPFEITQQSLGGIGNSLEEASGRKDDLKAGRRLSKMTLKRVTDLYTTAVMCRLSESWISNNPALLYVYLKQYLPGLVPFMYKMVGPSYMRKLSKKAGAAAAGAAKKKE